MEGLFRRKSGVYVARLTVPVRHQATVGQTTFIASTGSRELVVARIVAGGLVAGWRRRLHDLDRQNAGMDILQLTVGSPMLASGGHLTLADAARQSGIDETTLLRAAADGGLNLFVRCNGVAGHVIDLSDCEEVQSTSGVREFIVPNADQMPDHAPRIEHTGLLRLRAAKDCAGDILVGGEPEVVLLDLLPPSDQCFAPLRPLPVVQAGLEVAAVDVEAIRLSLARQVTLAQLDLARSAQAAVAAPQAPARNGSRRISEAVNLFMKDRAVRCSAEQARRIRAACDLFVELEGDPLVVEIDRNRLRKYARDVLPFVPANENKIRLTRGTRSVAESIKAVEGINWPHLSASEVIKRITWLSGLFRWLVQEEWIERDPCDGLVSVAPAAATLRAERTRPQDRRGEFTHGELQLIFGAPWFAAGRGQLTAAGTYREFTPFYYWGPLLGLYTGARINEIAQLDLTDIRFTANGIAYIDFNEDRATNDFEPVGVKRLKNRNSFRAVPLHPELIRLGLLEWCDSLKAAGKSRLFHELKFDQSKGYGKSATKWFSGYLGSLGLLRDNTKVFHSFRHTLATKCLNELGLSEELTAQISGHSRGASILMSTYRKDVTPEFLKHVERLDFRLPPIAVFDIAEGHKALSDALRRKRAMTVNGKPENHASD